MTRIILHIDMDAFFAQVEKRENPQFKEKPIVVGADPKGGQGRGVVSSASYSARRFGVKSGIPISKAYQLCPQAIFLPVNTKLYEKASENIMEIVKKYSRKWEIVFLDEAYLDISYCATFEQAKLLAERIKEEIFQREKLFSTIGIGPNKLIAKIACNQAKPDGLLIIKSNQVKKFLEPLDIEKIPGIGPKTAEKLRNLKINKIKELKNFKKLQLIELLGKVGESIYEKARGIDKSPVELEKVIKSIGKEITFEKDSRDSELIFKKFNEIIKEVHKEILADNFLFKTITVVCRFSGFETHTKSKTLKKTTNDLSVLQKESKKLLLKFIIENAKLIRLIGLRVKINAKKLSNSKVIDL